MALEDILRKIEEDAKKEAESILSDAKARAEAIKQSAETRAKQLEEELTASAKANAETHKSRRIAMGALDMRKAILQEKQNLIDESFRRASEKMAQISDEEYIELFKSMLMNLVERGDEEIVLCERDRERISQGLIQSINKKLKSDGKLGKLTISEDVGDFSGGFILRRGKVEINNSFDSLIQSARSELETEISQILFGE